MSNFNKFKSTTVYGDFNNKDVDANNTSNANGTFDRNVLIKGTLQANDCSFNTITFNGNITSNSLTITPTQLGYLKDVNNNIQSQINSITTLLQNTQYINGFGLNWYGAMNVFGGLLVTVNGNYINVGNTIANLSSTYVTTNVLNSVILNNAIDLSNNYVKNTSLANYVTNATLTSQLSNYITNATLTSQLSNYITNTSLTSQLSNYITNTSLVSQLSNYSTTAVLNNTFASLSVVDALSLTLFDTYTNTPDLYANFPTKTFLTGNYTTTADLSNNYLKISSLANYVLSSYLTSNYTTTSNLNANFVSQNKIDTTSTFNQINSTIVYGTFRNLNLNTNDTAYAYFQNQVVVGGGITSTNGVFTNLNITGNIEVVVGSINVLVSSLELSYLKNVSSNIQSQLNSITTNYVTNSSLTTSLSNYIPSSVLSTILTNYVQSTYLTSNFTTTIDLSNNYVKFPALATQLLSYAPISSLSSYATVSSLSSYATVSSLSSYATNTSVDASFLKIIDASNNYTLYSTFDGYRTYLDAKILSIETGYSTLSYVNGQFISISNNFLLKSDASNNYLKITDASNNYVKNTTLTSTLSSYVTSTSLTSTLSSYVTSTSLTSTLGSYVTSASLPTTDLQVASLNVRSANSNINIYTNTGVLNGTISSTGGFFNLTASGNSTSGFKLTGGPVILGTGYRGRQGITGLTTNNTFNQWWTGGQLQAYVDSTGIGNFTICDYRIKENIQPPSNVLDRLCSVNMFNYEMKDIGIFKKNGNHIGFFAHELKDTFPELNNIVDGEKDAVNENGDMQPQTITAELTHLLMKSIQELNAKVIELSNKIVELENKLS